jgi:signal transduction histidine kinase
MGKTMRDETQTILLVSNDASLCSAARREFEAKISGVRVSAVSNMEAARRVVEEHAPAVILLEEASAVVEAEGPRGIAARLDAVVTSLAVYAPVVVLGTGKRQPELSALIAAGAADYVARDEGSLAVALGLIQRRLRQAEHLAGSTPEHLDYGEEDFGELLRHELNNPLTGILGNAELLLVDIRRRNDGRLPQSGRQRLETIAALAVRLRETVRRLSQEWEARHHPVP